MRLIRMKWVERKISKKYARHQNKHVKHEFSINIVQEIKKNKQFENKIENINKGIEFINDLILNPSEIFSFWFLIPRANAKNGFKMSRNIIDGKLTSDFGGGLCQLSSILYHSALLSGLKIIERHNHSVDLYTEEERFTPLGADATVVYGYKNLRFENSHKFPIKIFLKVENYQLYCEFSSSEKLIQHEILFEAQNFEKHTELKTYRVIENESILLDKSTYLKMEIEN